MPTEQTSVPDTARRVYESARQELLICRHCGATVTTWSVDFILGRTRNACGCVFEHVEGHVELVAGAGSTASKGDVDGVR